ncbi:MAG: acyltransferase family protein [Gallionella sp.]|nr:acyltransferase family protein [Gallionella sp.]
MNTINRLVPQLKYRPDIDGLRALAVLAVVLHHLSASLLPGGYVGVDVFFVISGYLITGIISREISEGQFTFKRFYQRRIRRIFPALFAMMTVVMIAGYFLLLPSDYAATLRAVLGTLFFSSNVVFWRDMAAGYFVATDFRLNPLLHTWSLGVEEQFYVVFPVLLLVCYRYFRKYIVLILVLGALLTLAASAFLVVSKSVAVFFLSPFRAWELLVGGLLAYNFFPQLRNQVQRDVLAGAGLLAILVACFLYGAKTTFPGFAAIVPVFGAVAILHAGANGTTLVGRVLTWRPIVYLGLISYSLYLWHWPLIVLTGYAIGMEPLKPYLLTLFVVSLLLGSLSYHFIEQPFRHSGTVTRKVVFTSAAVFSILLAVVSVVGLIKNGFANRYDAKVIEFDQARAPELPFNQCADHLVKELCGLGAMHARPTVAVWGDSHAVAWAPALNDIFNEQGEGAVLATLYSCPPLLDVTSSIQPDCAVHNLSVKKYLQLHPEITTVIMSAKWSTYFSKEGGLVLTRGARDIYAAAAAREALVTTLKWLKNNGKQVVLVGPVPIYEKSVPLALGLEAATHRELLHSTADEQRRKHAPFFEVIQTIQPSTSFHFLDPIEWICNDQCVSTKNGHSLYRDDNHLNVIGAMAYKSYFDVVFTADKLFSMKQERDTPGN